MVLPHGAASAADCALAPAPHNPRMLASPARATLLAGLLASVAGGAAAQGSCVDQLYSTARSNGLEITGTQSVVQTLTCARAGMLLRVDVDIKHHVPGVTTALDVNILAVDANGVPTNQVLASAQLAASEIPVASYALVPVRFTQPMQVSPGQVIGIELAVPNTVARAYAWSGDAPGGYAAGDTFIRRTSGPLSYDMGFRTWVGAPAFQVNYGTGHPGTGGVPSLRVAAVPRLGTTIDLLVGNSTAATVPALLLVGTARASLPTPFGGTLLVQIAVQLPLTVPAAGAVVPLALPDLPSLCGDFFDLQAVLADPGASHGVAFTRGLELVVGA